MRRNLLRQLWRDNACAINGWLAIPASYSAEGMAHQGYDCVTVDLQHGMIDAQTALGMLQAISTTAAVPLVRVGSADPVAVMKMLDAGAYGIICPMVSTRAEAEQFVDTCRYPPAGHRSFGPARGLLYGGADYFKHANDEILVIGMVETEAGLANIDAICSVPGLDAIYIGPNDLCLDLGEPPKSEPGEGRAAAAIEHIRARTAAAGKKCGIFCSGGAAALERKKQGFDLVTPGNDMNLLLKAARAEVEIVRSSTTEPTPGGY